MNKTTRRFLIKTNFFELKIFWNSSVVFAHSAVLIGLLIIGLLGINPTVKKASFFLFCAYVVFLIFLLCRSASFKEITDEKKPAKKPVKKEEVVKNKVEPKAEAEPEKESAKTLGEISAETMSDDEWRDFFNM